MITSHGFRFEKSAGQERLKYGALGGRTGSVRDHFLYGGEGRMDTDVESVLEVVPGVVLLQAKVVTNSTQFTDVFKILKSMTAVVLPWPAAVMTFLYSES